VNPRGALYNSIRLTDIILDDIDTNERCLSEDRMIKLKDWLDAELIPATAPNFNWRIIYVGNRFNNKQLLCHFAKKPLNYYSKVNLLDEFGEPSWKENHTAEKIQKYRESISSIQFMREYMNTPIQSGAIFKSEHLQLCDMDYSKITKAVIALDPSWTSSSKSDYKAGVLLLSDGENFYIDKAYCRRADMTNFVDWTYDVYRKLRMNRLDCLIYFESLLNQNILAQEFDIKAAEYNQQLPLILDKSVKAEKYMRIEAIQPFFERRRMFVNRQVVETQDWLDGQDQLFGFHKNSKMNDDFPDVLQYALSKINSFNDRDYSENDDLGYEYDKYSNF